MAADLISKKTRYEFREYFVNTTLREIEMEFDAADVPFDEDYQPKISGQRRSLVEQYYHAVDWTKWNDVRKILIVYENVLSQLEEQIENNAWESGSDWARSTFNSLKKWLEKDGFQYSNGKLEPVAKSVNLTEITNQAIKFDIPELIRQIERMRLAVEDDPGLAIGTAKELIETTCKTILSDHDIEFQDSEEITKLVKKARKIRLCHLRIVIL